MTRDSFFRALMPRTRAVPLPTVAKEPKHRLRAAALKEPALRTYGATVAKKKGDRVQ